METEQNKNNELWQIAKRRAAFKWSFASYVLVNAFLVAVWYFTDNGYFWPKWCMLGWGIGIVLQYLSAYHTGDIFLTEKEYEKLKNKN